MYPKNLFEQRELHVKWPFGVVNTHYTVLSYFFSKSVFLNKSNRSPHSVFCTFTDTNNSSRFRTIFRHICRNFMCTLIS